MAYLMHSILGAGAVGLAVAGGYLLARPAAHGPLEAGAQAAMAAVPDAAEVLPRVPAVADPSGRAEKRLRRYDRDDDGQVSRDEFLANRRKAYAKLDTDGNGALSFDEFAIRTTERFSKADHDRDGLLGRDEFATTATRRKPGGQADPCQTAERASADSDERAE